MQRVVLIESYHEIPMHNAIRIMWWIRDWCLLSILVSHNVILFFCINAEQVQLGFFF